MCLTLCSPWSAHRLLFEFTQTHVHHESMSSLSVVRSHLPASGSPVNLHLVAKETGVSAGIIPSRNPGVDASFRNGLIGSRLSRDSRGFSSSSINSAFIPEFQGSGPNWLGEFAVKRKGEPRILLMCKVYSSFPLPWHRNYWHPSPKARLLWSFKREEIIYGINVLRVTDVLSDTNSLVAVVRSWHATFIVSTPMLS